MEEQYRILLVDDETDILEFLGYNLRKEGFEVFTAQNGKEALKVAKEKKPHLTLLDVMMPQMDGMETCKEMRKDTELKDTIIVFLTARSEDYSQIAGFDVGGDDYVTKPVRPKVLVSRLKALLRRKRPESTQSRLELNGLVIDKERYLVIKDKEEIVLPKKEFELLYLFCSQPNKVFTRHEIFSKVWGDGVIVGDRTIDVHVRKIREKLKTKNIKTVKGVGYKFEV